MRNGVKMFRELKGVSQSDLARLVGTTRQQMGRLERGERQLTMAWAEKIARHLGCKPAELMYPDISSHDMSDMVPVYPLIKSDYLDPGLKLSSAVLSHFLPGQASNKFMEMTVQDDDMQKHFRRGDIVLVDTDSKAPTRPGVYAIAFNDAILWRHLSPLTEPGMLQMKADNENIAVERVSAQDIKIIGRARLRLSLID